MNPTARICVTALALVAFAPTPGPAIDLGSNLVELSRRSSFVVAASVDRFQTCPSKEGHIFTYVWFSNVETIEKERGPSARNAPGQLILRIPGGMVHGMVEMLTDAPVFRRGERVLLFLTRDPQQQAPIVFGTNGVFLLGDEGRVRVYAGPMVTEIDRRFSVLVDPEYKPNPADARHWDPNMVAVWKEPEEGTPLGRPPARPEARPPVQLDAFRTRLKEAWAEADRLGRLPKVLDFSPRRPYGEMPTPPRKGGES